MAKHKRFSDNTNSDKKEFKKTESSEQDDVTLEEQTVTSKNTDPKSFLISGMKYIYIIVIAALFSGIFTPLTLGINIEIVLTGMVFIFFGLSGAILIFLGLKTQKYAYIMFIGGSGIILASIFLMYEIIEYGQY